MFTDIERELLGFLKSNMNSSSNFIETHNLKGKQQVRFEVKGARNKEWTMVVAVSDPPMKSNSAFSGNHKPIRSIITIFFIPKYRSMIGTFLKWILMLIIFGYLIFRLRDAYF